MTAHGDEFRGALARYLGQGHRAGSTAWGAAVGRRTAVDNAEVREWSKGQGIEIKERGRVPASVLETYKTATGV